jgi:hypothetical protein
MRVERVVGQERVQMSITLCNVFSPSLLRTVDVQETAEFP